MLLLTLLSFGGFCQPIQEHFIYLQTENKQTFYVRLNNKILSSSASGYIIIPQLKDSTYQFYVGFPAKEWSEQKMKLLVGKDEGFLLKNFESKGWGLFNLQTFAVVMNENNKGEEPVATTTVNDQFSNLLSEVVNDSSIKQSNVPSKPIINKDSITQSAPVVEKKLPDTLDIINIMGIKKLPAKTVSGVVELIYIDDDGRVGDTVKTIFDLIKPLQNSGDSSVTKPQSKKDTSKIDTEVDINKAINQPEESSVKPDMVEKKDAVKQLDFLVMKTPMVNSNCTETASQTDLEKLERKMVSESSDDDKIKVAKKTFKVKCFSTAYIKQLSRLFITSAGKYNFFDMGYPFVYDSGLYYTLESELLDSYYIKRFQALINK